MEERQGDRSIIFREGSQDIQEQRRYGDFKYTEAFYESKERWKRMPIDIKSTKR